MLWSHYICGMTLAQNGIVHVIEQNGDISLDALSQYPDFKLDDLYEVIRLGLICRSEEDILYPVGQDEQELKKMFDVFRRAFPGSKRGVDPEFADLKKKHKKEWRKVIPQLLSNLERQEREREMLAADIEMKDRAGVRNHGLFVAPWQNLSTYLNGSNWTRVYYAISKETRETVDAIFPQAESNYGIYRRAWMDRWGSIGLNEEIYLLQLDEFNQWSDSTGVFDGRRTKMSVESAKKFFWDNHSNYYNSTQLQRNYRTIFSYMLEQFNKL